MQVETLLTLGAEVVAEAGLTVLNLAFCRQKQNGVWPRLGWASSFIPGPKAYLLLTSTHRGQDLGLELGFLQRNLSKGRGQREDTEVVTPEY